MFKHSSFLSAGAEGLPLLTHCPVCRCSYQQQKVEVIAEKISARLAHITCANCHNALLAIIVNGALGMSTVGMLTDLTANDARRLRSGQVISEDELLFFYKFLETKQFNFKY